MISVNYVDFYFFSYCLVLLSLFWLYFALTCFFFLGFLGVACYLHSVSSLTSSQVSRKIFSCSFFPSIYRAFFWNQHSFTTAYFWLKLFIFSLHKLRSICFLLFILALSSWQITYLLYCSLLWILSLGLYLRWFIYFVLPNFICLHITNAEFAFKSVLVMFML